MGLINLEIYPRSTKGKNANRRSRAAGRIPAVIYGKDRVSDTIELDEHDFRIAMRQAGGSAAIFKLEGDEEIIALLREIQTDPVTDQMLHVDLMQIPRGVPVTVGVSVQIVGTPNDVKTGEGSVALSLDTIDLSVRPSELPEFIEIDISELNLNDKIFVKDVIAPVGEIITDPEMLILNIKPATIIIEEEEEVEGEEGEGVEGEEGEEGAEGAEDGDKAADSGEKDKKK